MVKHERLEKILVLGSGAIKSGEAGESRLNRPSIRLLRKSMPQSNPRGWTQEYSNQSKHCDDSD